METVPQHLFRKIVKIFFIAIVAALLVGLIIYFQTRRVSLNNWSLSQSKKSEIISNLNQTAKQVAPLSATDKAKIISDLGKVSAKTLSLSDAEKARIISELEK